MTTTTATPYEARIAENMRHMGCALTEWQAVEITGFADTTDATGQAVKMPQFAFPAGYTSAPSIYRNQNSASCNCELCGHDIKNVYWIKNDNRKWLLAVGSECVTHFGAGQSGTELSAARRSADNRNLLIEFVTLVESLHEVFAFRASIGYGRTQEAWTSDAARGYYRQGSKLQGKLDRESTDGAVSGWITRKGDAVKAFLAEVKAWLATSTAKEYARRNLTSRKNSAESILISQRANGQPAAQWQLDQAKSRKERAEELLKLFCN